MLRCTVCERVAETRDELEQHIAAEHVHSFAYYCEHCRFAKFSTEHALRQHYINDHRQNEFFIRFKVTPALDEKRREVERLVKDSIDNRNSPRDHDNGHHSVTVDTVVRAPLSPFVLAKHELPNEDEPQVGMGNFETNTLNELATLLSSSEFPADLSNAVPGVSYNSPVNRDAKSEITAIHNQRMPQNAMKRKHASSPIQGGSQQAKSTTNGAGAGTSQVSCLGCGKAIANYKNSMQLHVSTHHMDRPIYECLGCDKAWFSLSARYKEHMRSRHDNDMSLIKDNRAEFAQELRQLVHVMFPKHNEALC